ncbi:DinB family protein [Smaragdicoccus niigatensis]|uniref:DinB family protein n=1 Tax=Smaragdicoccus niigatensis TaxID=359359 RepID=UPI00036E710C|nr:DinB family protein [Smaragdicoccus niigatensis]
MTIIPDTKDWTWVLGRPCAECGFDAAEMSFEAVPGRTREAASVLAAALALPGAQLRPVPGVWSPLEYAAHVRDVCRIFGYRLSVVLTGRGEDPGVPAFDPAVRFVNSVAVLTNWDQDDTAVAADYRSQSPEVVSQELLQAAGAIADAFARVTGAELSRTVRRSDGAVFSVTTFAQYFVHDLVHHVHDVRG